MRNFIWILLAATLSLGSLRAETPVEERQKKALEILRKAMAERQRKTTGKGSGPAKSRTAAPEQTFAEIEQQYLEGKITSKQFQKYIHDHPDQLPSTLPNPSSGSQPSSAANSRANPIASPTTAVPTMTAPAQLQRATPASTTSANTKAGKTEATPEQKATLAEIETKMDELERLKAARDKIQQTERLPAAPAAQASTPAPPKPQRERLNDLLKLLVDGKITDADYKEKRAKIIAEPHR